jgi:DNA-binding response OmpR family regulator
MSKLLIIDDDESVRKLVRFRLKNSYEIIDTGSPEEALAMALQEKPDAILLDLMMPKYSGFEVCQTVSSLSFTQHIPIIIVSGQSSARYRDFCESLGAKDYVEKPIDFEALKTKLAKLIDHGRNGENREPHVRLRVVLRLRSADSSGTASEVLTVTESVTPSGFVCGYQAAIKEGAVVEVYMQRNGRHLVGKAQASHIEWLGTPGQRVNFSFVEKPTDWILR